MDRETEAKTTHAEGLVGRELSKQVMLVDFYYCLVLKAVRNSKQTLGEIYTKESATHTAELGIAWSIHLTFPDNLGLISPAYRWSQTREVCCPSPQLLLHLQSSACLELKGKKGKPHPFDYARDSQ